MQFPLKHLLPPPLLSPIYNPPPFPSEKDRPPRYISQLWHIKFLITLLKNSHIQNGQGNPIGGKGLKSKKKKSQKYALLPLLSAPQEHQTNNHNIYAENTSQIPTGSLSVISVSRMPKSPG